MFLKKFNIKLFLKVVFTLFFTLIITEFSFRAYLSLKSIATYKNSDKNYNLCMVGGSTSKGIPFNEKISIPKLVSYTFKDTLDGKKINIYNISEAGMPISKAYWDTRELTLGIKKGTMLLYTGINDTYNNNEDDTNFFLLKLLHKSWVLSKIYYLYNPWQGSKDHYEFYYEEILKILNAKKWTVISSTLVGNYSDFAPNIHNVDFIESKLFNNIHQNIPVKYPIEVDSINRFNENAYLFYKTGKYYLKENNIDSANRYFMFAVDVDYSIRPSSYKNKFIKDISKQYNIVCVDANHLFYTTSGGVLPGYNLFMDAHHPTLKGYALIAELFVGALKETHQIDEKKSIKLNAIENAFNLTPEFYANAYLETAIWHILESFYTLSYHDRLQKAGEFLHKADSQIFDKARYYYWNCLLLLLEEDYEKWSYFYTKYKEEINFSYPIKHVQNFERIEEKLNQGIIKSEINKKHADDFLSKLN